jgi:outer membrane protein assembly factor BamB
MTPYDPKTGSKRMSVVGLSNAPVSLPVAVQANIYYSEPPGEPIPMAALGNADQNKDGVIELDEVKGSLGTYRLIERLDQGFGNADGKVDQAEWDKGFGSFLNKGGLSCVQLQNKNGQLEGTVKWKYTKTAPYISSAIVIDGLVYIINDGGILICFDADSGDLIKRERLREATGQYYASPIAAGDRILFSNLQGKLTLVRAGREFSVLSSLDLGESIVATPSIHQGRLFVRTKSQLYCFDKEA